MQKRSKTRHDRDMFNGKLMSLGKRMGFLYWMADGASRQSGSAIHSELFQLADAAVKEGMALQRCLSMLSYPPPKPASELAKNRLMESYQNSMALFAFAEHKALDYYGKVYK